MGTSRLKIAGAALFGVVALMWLVAPLSRNEPPLAATPPASFGRWIPASPATIEEDHPVAESPSTTRQTASPNSTLEVELITHTEHIPTPQMAVTVTGGELPVGLVAAIEKRLTAELTGVGRELYPTVVWRSVACCMLLTLTGIVVDIEDGDQVRVVVEWLTDNGPSGGVSYWTRSADAGWLLGRGGT